MIEAARVPKVSGNPPLPIGWFSSRALMFALALVSLFSSHASVALDYYVSAKAGSDANSGNTSASPWRSLAKVEGSRLKAGDRVLFERGSEWWGSLTILSSGEPQAPITLTSYGDGDLPRIFAGVEIKGDRRWEKDATSVPDAVFYKAFVQPRRAVYGLWHIRAGMDPEPAVFCGTAPSACLEGEFSYDNNGWIWLRANEVPLGTEADHYVFADAPNALLLKQANYVIVEDISVGFSNYSGERYNGGIGVVGQDQAYVAGVVLRNLESRYNSHTGVAAVFVDGLVIENVLVTHGARAGGIYISGGSRGVRIVNSEAAHNGLYKNVQGADRAGISIGGAGAWHIAPVVDSCKSHHNGLKFGGYKDAGIHFFQVAGGKIVNSLSYENGAAGIMINGAGPILPDEKSLVENNFVLQNGVDPESMYAGGIVLFRPADILRNTIMDNQMLATSVYRRGGIAMTLPEIGPDLRINGNLLANNARRMGEYELYLNAAAEAASVDGNCYFNDATTSVIFRGKLGERSWDEYRLLNLEPGSQWTPPQGCARAGAKPVHPPGPPGRPSVEPAVP